MTESLVSGDYRAIVAHYQQLVEQNPNDLNAVWHLGLALWLQGETETAQTIWWATLADLELAGSQSSTAFVELMTVLRQGADRLFQAEQYGLAIDLYQQIQEHQADDLAVGMNLAFALVQQGDLAAAATCYQQLLATDPENPVIWYNLAGIFQQQGDLEQAIDHYQQVLKLDSLDEAASYNLGVVLTQQGKLEAAIDLYRRLISQKDDFADAYFGLGIALTEQGQGQAAIVAYQQAIHLDPSLAAAYTNLGVLCAQQGQLSEAETYYQQAIHCDNQPAEAFNNLGALLASQRRFQEAMQAWEQAIVLNPNYADAHCNRARLNLRLGNLQAGFAEHERWRWHLAEQTGIPFFQPIWDGTDLQGQTLLLWAEQGFGDSIQFCRYLPWVAQFGGKLILECPAPLSRLFRLAFSDIGQVVERGQPLPPCDRQLPLTSLPWRFDTDLEHIPAQVPYLKVPPAVECLPLSHREVRLKVGIVWASKPHNPGSRSRSCSLQEFQDLLSLPGIEFYSLQKGEPLQALEELPKDLRPCNLDARLQDFADTAGVINQLDLVITIDTAVAHLAGALGKPVWVLLTWFADWRWLHDRTNSPWYPTMRLFRQLQPGDWRSVFTEVLAALRTLSHRPSDP